jgi:nitrogen fixation-related uncharacterized protein
MSEGTIALTIMTGLILLIFLGFLAWGWVSGQFKNVEEAKYRMLENNLKSTDRPPEGYRNKEHGDKTK